jgi:CRISPR system Cascade subunit CasE
LDSLNGRLYLLLLSPERPDFENFAQQFCARGVSGEIKDYDALLTRLEPGQKWRFRLRANAAHSVAERKGERGKIHAHITTAYQREWLLKKASKCGFSLEEGGFDVVQAESIQFRRNAQPDARTTIGTAVYEGELTVVDVSLFREALQKGIGRAKAYGCGFLTIARPS